MAIRGLTAEAERLHREASIMNATGDKMKKDFKKAEGLSLPITLFVLLFAFGALVGALLPVALAMSAVLGATGLLAFASHINPVDGSAASVLLLVSPSRRSRPRRCRKGHYVGAQWLRVSRLRGAGAPTRPPPTCFARG
jgi:hypothetical protein